MDQLILLKLVRDMKCLLQAGAVSDIPIAEVQRRIEEYDKAAKYLARSTGGVARDTEEEQ